MNKTTFDTRMDDDVEWRPVVGYEGLYEVSNLGSVRSLPRMTAGRWGNKKINNGALLKGSNSKSGKKKYIRYTLCKEGVAKRMFGHRIVATAFIPNPLNKPQVNHIDSNERNNRVDNLEWCTAAENTQHGVRAGNIPGSGIVGLCINGHEKEPGKYNCTICTKLWIRQYRATQRTKLATILEGSKDNA